MWNAQWGAGQVQRYAPDGRVLERVETPGAMQPTCVAFAGPALDLLCVTTARIGLSPAALASQAHAGDVFIYRTGARGLAESRARWPAA